VRDPEHPIVLITAPDSENLRHIQGTPVDEILFPNEIDESSAAADRACATDHIKQIRKALVKLPKPTRALAIKILDERLPPVHSVQALANRQHRDRRTLWQCWNQPLIAGPRISLKEFIVWAYLLRARMLKHPRISWSEIARELDIPIKTLARSAQRIAGRSLGELSDCTVQDLANEFLRRIQPTP
jgi:hypothetical protein